MDPAIRHLEAGFGLTGGEVHALVFGELPLLESATEDVKVPEDRRELRVELAGLVLGERLHAAIVAGEAPADEPGRAV